MCLDVYKRQGLERERNNLSERKDRLKSEYDALPGDTDLREADVYKRQGLRRGRKTYPMDNRFRFLYHI